MVISRILPLSARVIVMLSIDALQQQQQPLIAIFRGHMHARARGHCRRGKPCLSSEYALDSVRAEGSSIVDGPGKC